MKNSIPSWDDTEEITASSNPSWDDTTDYSPEPIRSKVSQVESIARGGLQGASFGFSDEITGGLGALWDKMSSDEKSKTFSELYIHHRDESRANNKAAQEANPASYTSGQIGGGIASAFATAGLAAPVATAGAAARAGAAYGALQGLGDSESEDLQGMVTDTAFGGAIGGVTGGVIKAATPYASKAYNAITSKGKDTLNKGISKLGSFASGVDEDALLRQIQRPVETAAADVDDFAYKLGNEALDEIYNKGDLVGKNVGDVTNTWLKNNGSSDVGGIGQQAASLIDDFIVQNAPSQKGFSSISKSQMGDLEELSKVFKGSNMTGEDLVKSRGYIDFIEGQAKKYDVEGTGPYSNFLKQLRGTLDRHLDMISPEIDRANTAFSAFKDDKKILGLRDQRTQESVMNNLYGKNKTAQQEAASRLLSPEVMKKSLDIEANKAIAGAVGPSGSDYGRRTMLAHVTAIPTFGLSEVIVSPKAWKHALRSLGTAELKIAHVLKNAPQVLGKYAPILEQANLRGAAALTATHFILQQNDPTYRQAIKQMEQDDE